MNTRILELVKNPELIQAADLPILQKEISEKPYAQSIRALYLYGVNQFDTENYKKELTTTAAYTTDKKILYQFINNKAEKNLVKEASASEKYIPTNNIEQKPMTISEKTASKFNITKTTFPLPRGENKPVFVEGEQNRILFEGEENFLNEETTEIIELTSSQESETLNIQQAEPVTTKINSETELQLSESKEKVEEISTTTFHESTEENIEIVPDNSLIQNKEKIVETTPTESIEVNRLESEEKIMVSEINEEEEEPSAKNQDPALEIIVPENTISDEKSIVEDTSELSFHGLDAFLPEVNIQSQKAEKHSFKPTPPPVNKHEEEMKRLIEEVERKMREKKKTTNSETSKSETLDAATEIHKEINFSETQEFSLHNNSVEIKDVTPKKENNEIVFNSEIQESSSITETVNQNEVIHQKKWQPMSFDSHLPDALLSKPSVKVSTPIIEEATQKENKEEILRAEEKTFDEKPISNQADLKEEIIKDEKTDIPVMNLSFFSTNVSVLPTIEKDSTTKEAKTVDIKNNLNKEEIKEVSVEKSSVDSNIPTFINTWQSWLKIDRTAEIEKQKAETKNKAIDVFIENSPKISQLKDEVNFVVKEKTDDISHLMTETLANLYVEQKLYSKSIQAFQILIEKYPEKKKHFEDRIKEIKEIRGRN